MATIQANTGAMSGPILAEDGTPLKIKLRRALRLQKFRAFMLVAPLLLFVLLSFIAPIADMLLRSVDNTIVPETLPKTVAALQEWDAASDGAPGEAVFAAMHADLLVAFQNKTHTRIGVRLNYQQPGVASLFRKTGRRVKRMEAPYKEAFLNADDRWGDPQLWGTIKSLASPYTATYFADAVDRKFDANNDLVLKDEDQRIYVFLFERTIWMSILITFLTFLLGYPIAYLLATLPARIANLLMILVLLPFWTSLLVRTSAWIVLLQEQGVVNDSLVWIGAISNDGRLEMMYNQVGTLVAMTHILLPFMILPLYSVMKSISPTYVRAAKSLGASNWTAFWRVYFPNTLPGVGAGGILVFILAIGYYITPELVGGTEGIFISNRIAFHISSSLNWGLASALAVLLLAAVLILYYVYDRIVGIDNVKLG